MKPIVWTRHVKISTNGTAPVGDGVEIVSRLSFADKAAFLVLAAGLVALGGVLFAAGLALLLALAGVGLVVGTAAVVRYRLFGRGPTRLGAGEIPATGAVLPHTSGVTRASSAPVAAVLPAPPPPGPAPRAD
jgi:hypothetical protein